MSARDNLLAKIEAQHGHNPSSTPVVGLDEYFEANTSEDSIAPNQIGWGRPPLAELYARFKAIEARPNVQAVLVGLHPDWREAVNYPDIWPAAENIHIYTTASAREVETWIEGLCADGVIKGWPYGAPLSAPGPNAGYKVFTVCWD